MSLFSSFRKPAWQSTQADKRAAAVASDTDAELIAALPRLAVEDADADVRRHALRRCDDPALFAKAMRSDADAGVRNWARQRWLSAVTDGRLADPSDADLEALTPAEAESIATASRDAALRSRVFARITRAGFLAERALADPDPTVRTALVDRIDAVATLDRIAEKARKTDKKLSRHAAARSETLRLGAGDNSARQRRAEAVCNAVEQLMRTSGTPESRAAELARLEADWNALDPVSTSETIRTRYEGALHVIRAQLAPPPVIEIAEIAEAEPIDDTAIEPVVVEVPPSPEEIAAQARLQADIAANAERIARERARADEQRKSDDRRRAEQDDVLAQLSAALEAGDLSKSRTLSSSIEPRLLSTAGQRTWQALQPQIKTLEGWEHWAGNKVRSRLCEDLEQLIGSGLHPDALATRVREVQQEWKRLDALEGRTSDSTPTGLDKRFRVACARVLKPARGFFEKRDALRSERQEGVAGFIAEAEAALETADGPALIALQRAATDHLRGLGDLGHGDRKGLAKRLRDLLDSIRPRVESGFQQSESERQTLIEAAKRLVGETDGRRAGTEAKNLMERWKRVGKGRMARDQAQWREFRAALDAVFAGLDERRKAVETERADNTRQAEALVVELEGMASLEGEALAASQTAVRDLRDRWQSFGVRDAALGERYDNALTRHRDGLRAIERDRRRHSYLAAITDSGVAASEPSSGIALEQGQSLVFEAESIADIEAPADERDSRRQWQMERLQRHMRGDKAGAPDDAIGDILARWRALEGLDAADRARYAQRLTRAVEQILAGS
jgi:exonuclease SbcC